MEAPAADAILAAHREAAFAEMARRQSLFDATRPPCPKHWCDEDCETNGHVGDAIIHSSDSVTVETTADNIHKPIGSVEIRSWRYDALDEPTTSGVEVDLTNAGWMFIECANFNAAQARKLAAEMLRHADLIDPEPEVPATDVRVGDWLRVDSEWFRIYGITIDEPTDSVQIYTTVDWEELPEFGGDEEAHEFDIKDMVRVRRQGLTTSKDTAGPAEEQLCADHAHYIEPIADGVA